MKSKLSSRGVVTMLMLTLPCITLAAEQNSVAHSLNPRESKMLATASILALISPTNCTEVANIMMDEVREQWQETLDQLRLDGAQMFLPDFCKVKYTMIGGYDDHGFVMGLYNPFYDTYMVFRVEDRQRARISGFRLVSPSTLSGSKTGADLPKSCGVTSAVDYFPALLEQVRTATEIFKLTLQSPSFRMAFEEIQMKNLSDLERVKRIQEFRVAMDIMRSQDKRTLRDTALALAVVRDGRGENSDLVSRDASTKLTRETLSEKIAPVRGSLIVVASFVAGGSNNILLATPRVPTLLILAHVERDARMWLRMFDAHSIGVQKLK